MSFAAGQWIELVPGPTRRVSENVVINIIELALGTYYTFKVVALPAKVLRYVAANDPSAGSFEGSDDLSERRHLDVLSVVKFLCVHLHTVWGIRVRRLHDRDDDVHMVRHDYVGIDDDGRESISEVSQRVVNNLSNRGQFDR